MNAGAQARDDDADPGAGSPSAAPGFGFRIAVAPSSAVRLLRLAVLGLGAAGLALAAWLARGQEHGVYLLVLGALMLWAGWRHGRLGLAWGLLDVDDRGKAAWRPSAFVMADSEIGAARVPGSGAGPLAAVRVERWFAGEKLAWLRLRDAAGARHDILVARAALDADNWRRLLAWLAWLKRGAASS